jgi:hypothetical protein
VQCFSLPSAGDRSTSVQVADGNLWSIFGVGSSLSRRGPVGATDGTFNGISASSQALNNIAGREWALFAPEKVSIRPPVSNRSTNILLEQDAERAYVKRARVSLEALSAEEFQHTNFNMSHASSPA